MELNGEPGELLSSGLFFSRSSELGIQVFQQAGEDLNLGGHFLRGADVEVSRPPTEDSGGFQREIHMNGIKRKVDETLVGLLQYAGVQKRVHVAMNRFYVPS